MVNIGCIVSDLLQRLPFIGRRIIFYYLVTSALAQLEIKHHTIFSKFAMLGNFLFN